jgi:hypothetical protein
MNPPLRFGHDDRRASPASRLGIPRFGTGYCAPPNSIGVLSFWSALRLIRRTLGMSRGAQECPAPSAPCQASPLFAFEAVLESPDFVVDGPK